MDKTVLITGASSGIGEATARALVREGAKVVAFARSADKLDSLQRELGENCLAVPGDVTNQADLDQAVALATERFGRVNAAFVNAGLFVTGPVAETDPNQWQQMIEVNVLGAVRTVRAVLPQMIERGAGDILFTGSIAGRVVYPGTAVYAGTKHAVYALADGLRKEVYDKGIRVGVISPGYVANAIWGMTDPVEIRQEADRGEALTSEDIAETIVFLLSQPPNVNIADLLVLPSKRDVLGW
ncbi:MAG TPA: SDR family oxidoreductase [Capsulimonadaceae bacterium]|nr:SDR family oxidoreductase [Capsulimonadaceae bacterium]